MNEQTVAVVTGANRGLGRAAATRLAGMGQRVVATARRVADLHSLQAELRSAGHPIDCQQLDVTDDDSVAALARWMGEKYGHIDVLVNNAGIAKEPFDTNVLDLPIATLRETFETNLIGVLRVTQALVPLLRQSRAGRVVNLSSGMGQLSDMGTGAPAYRMSKTALNALTRILANDLKDSGIKVNAVCPGWCRTDMGGQNAPRSAAEGVDTVVWLAGLADDGPTGGFFRDRQVLAW